MAAGARDNNLWPMVRGQLHFPWRRQRRKPWR